MLGKPWRLCRRYRKQVSDRALDEELRGCYGARTVRIALVHLDACSYVNISNL